MLRGNDFKYFWHKYKSERAVLKCTMIASITFKYLEQGRCTGIALIFSQWFPWHKRIILFGTRGRRFCTCKFLCLHVQPCPFARATFPLLVRRDCLARANICCLLVQRDVCTCKLPHRKNPQNARPSQKFQAGVYAFDFPPEEPFEMASSIFKPREASPDLL